MQDYERFRATTWRTYNQADQLTNQVASKDDWTRMTVVNGLVQGDHIKPNPIRFHKRTQATTACFRQLVDTYYGSTTTWRGEGDATIQSMMFFQGLKEDLMLRTFNVLDFADVQDRALAKIFDQLRGDSEVVVDLAEGSSTIRMLRSATAATRGVGSILQIIANLISKSGRKNSRGYDQVADLATQKWLEYRYGWQPLIGSFYDAFDNLMREEISAVRSIVARSADRPGNTEVVTRLNQSGKVPFEREWRQHRRVLMRYDFVVPQSGIWDWTSLSPASIAWELLPFSFVADWFVSVGDSLRNLENWWLWKTGFLGGYTTYTARYEEREYVDAFVKANAYHWYKYQGGAIRSLRFKERRVETTLPVPRGPRFRLKLSTEKIVDMAALVTQAVRRIR